MRRDPNGPFGSSLRRFAGRRKRKQGSSRQIRELRCAAIIPLHHRPRVHTGVNLTAHRRKSALWRRGIDALFVALAFAFGWASLTYPFGRDQGLYYYVGREWALRGSIPYRDVFDHKTPGIYLVHAACVTLFGETFWGIRLADLVAVIALGWVCGALVAKRRGMPRSPLRGLGSLAASVMIFGFLDFKATSEGEVWMVLFAVGALEASSSTSGESHRPSRKKLFAAGALAACSMLMKPLAAFLIFIVIAPIVWRGRNAWRKAVVELAVLGGGAMAVLLPTFLYFWRHNALRPMYELVVEANSLYMKHGSPIKKPVDLLIQAKIFVDWYHPVSYVFSSLLLLAFVRARVRRDRPGVQSHALAVAFCVAGWAAVCAQAKFYQGHWGVMIAGMTLVVTSVTSEVATLLPARLRAGSVPAAAVTLVVLFIATGNRFSEYREVNTAALQWTAKRSTRSEFTSHFHEYFVAVDVSQNEDCGNWLREHTTEEDFVAVRGFQPQVYASARRRYPGRLFWTVFALGPAGETRRAQWLEEDRQVLAAHPPEACSRLSQLGWKERY